MQYYADYGVQYIFPSLRKITQDFCLAAEGLDWLKPGHTAVWLQAMVPFSAETRNIAGSYTNDLSAGRDLESNRGLGIGALEAVGALRDAGGREAVEVVELVQDPRDGRLDGPPQP
jgi:hypothetical protein